MEISFLVIFGKIWPMTLYYSTRSFVKFLASLKVRKKSNFDWLKLVIRIQHKNMYMY